MLSTVNTSLSKIKPNGQSVISHIPEGHDTLVVIKENSDPSLKKVMDPVPNKKRKTREDLQLEHDELIKKALEIQAESQDMKEAESFLEKLELLEGWKKSY